MSGVNSNKICSVPQCKSKTVKGEISLHIFPKEAAVRKKWSSILRIRKKISDTMCVCSKHFKKTDFYPAPPGMKPERPRLKKGVLPSQNIPFRKHDRPKHKNKEKELRTEKRASQFGLNVPNFSADYSEVKDNKQSINLNSAGSHSHQSCSTETKENRYCDAEKSAVEALLELQMAVKGEAESNSPSKRDFCVRGNALLNNPPPFTLTEHLKKDKSINEFPGLPNKSPGSFVFLLPF